MKQKIWILLVSFVILLTVISFLLIFKENQETPNLQGIPFIFWSGFLVTVLVVFATYLASKFFPYTEEKKS